jgi:hypothetical protein
LALSAKSLNLNFWTTGAGTPKNHAGRLEARELFQPAFDLKGTTSMARKNLAAAALLSAGVLLLSGCATGFDAATSNQGNSGNGRSADVGAIQIRNATVVVDPTDTSRATVLMTVINTDQASDDVLNGVAAAESVGVAGVVNVPIPNKEVVNVGFESEYRIVLTSVDGALVPGTFVNLSFIFASGQSAPMSLLINEKSGFYADIKIPAADSATSKP